ncbi:SIS domain-containing protein [Terrabacter aerolatus]|uniref:Bifunctional glucose-6-phosphate/mannose-6-phosphate isomerase n=1 Tax=Terrabacter aerolatus TaxID=422442 RepID=A0A512D1J7_9MICO|nr:bifunctional glucose-6-phosphate/mannose-6-phosphate isomerase [Terrabacter aerolatus]
MGAVFDEARLDDEGALSSLDSSDTLRALAGAGAQVRRTMAAAGEAGLDRLRDVEPRGVVVAAAGGSVAVADLFEAVSRGAAALPVQSCSSGSLPGWVGALDVVIAVSQSGRAAGTLALAAEAARRGAFLVTVGAAGSPLADVCARAHGVHVPIDVGGSSSRTSVWAQATPALLAADAMGIASVSHATLTELADLLDRVATDARPSSESFVNPAKILATELAESTPIVLGEGPFGDVTARRAAAMFGRTGRVPVAHGCLPDAASQIVACFDGPLAPGQSGGGGNDDIFADPFVDGPSRLPLRLIMLRDTSAGDGHELADTVVSVAEDAGVRVSLVDAPAADPLLRLAHHVALTDFAATYLALGFDFDPATSPHVRLLRGARGA